MKKPWLFSAQEVTAEISFFLLCVFDIFSRDEFCLNDLIVDTTRHQNLYVCQESSVPVQMSLTLYFELPEEHYFGYILIEVYIHSVTLLRGPFLDPRSPRRLTTKSDYRPY